MILMKYVPIVKSNGFEIKKDKTQSQCGWSISKEKRKWDERVYKFFDIDFINGGEEYGYIS